MKSDQYHLVNNTVSHINFLSLLFLQFVFLYISRDPPQSKGHIQTESEGLEKNISCKWRPKERPKETKSRSTHIR